MLRFLHPVEEQHADLDLIPLGTMDSGSASLGSWCFAHALILSPPFLHARSLWQKITASPQTKRLMDCRRSGRQTLPRMRFAEVSDDA